METNTNPKIINKMKKEIEDYYKSWVHKTFQKGLKNAKVYLHKEIVILIGYEFLTYMEQALSDDDYSKQAILHTRRKLSEKFYPVLKQNIELITGREVIHIFVDFSVEENVSCMTLFLDGEVNV